MTDDGDPPSEPPNNPPGPPGDAPADPSDDAVEAAGAADEPSATSAAAEPSAASAAPASPRPAPLPRPPSHGHPSAADVPPLARTLTRIDDKVGAAERVLLFIAFIVLVSTGLYRTALSQIWHGSSLKAIELSRLSAFAIGIFGGVYAAHSRRNFGLDLVSALMSTRFKAWTRVFTNLAALFAAGLLFYGGRLIQEALTKEKQHYELIPLSVVGWFIPIAALLIMFHVLLHLIIEVDYLRQGKTAPEPEVVG